MSVGVIVRRILLLVILSPTSSTCEGTFHHNEPVAWLPPWSLRKARRRWPQLHKSSVPTVQHDSTPVGPYYNSSVFPSIIDRASDYPPSSSESRLFPGRHKWLGGAIDEQDGCIYGIPSHARSVICLHPSEQEGYQVRTIALPPSVANFKFKWLRAILAHGYLYGIPSWANSILQVDVDALWGRRPACGDIIKLLPLPKSHSPGRRWQWHGAALNANRTAIYAIPSNAESVLKLDLVTHTTSFISIDIPSRYSNFQFNHTNKWYGGILGDDNAVYGIPYRTCSVLRIDCDSDTATLVGPDFGCELYNWHGGIQVNGNIYAFPSHSPHVLKIETSNQSMTEQPSMRLLPIHRASNDNDTNTNYKWLGGSLSADSRFIFGMPCDSSSILKINVENDHCSSFGYTGNAKKKWQGGVLARDGSVYAIPSYGQHVLRIDTQTPTKGDNRFQILGELPGPKDKYQGAFIGKGGDLYAIPENAHKILRVTPAKQGDDFSPTNVQIGML